MNLPESVVAGLALHRQEQDRFRQEFGHNYRSDLDLIFANTDGFAIEAGHDIGVHLSALPPAWPAEGSQPSHTAPQSWASLTRRWRGSGDGVRTIGALLRSRDGRHLFPRAPRGRDQEAARRWDHFMNRHTVTPQEKAKASVN